MKRIAQLLIATLFAVAAEAAETVSDGDVNCVRSAPEQSCRMAWSWRVAPRQFVWLEQFDPAKNSWRQLAEFPAMQTGRSEAAVEDGRLYRLRSCDDSSGSVDCISSSIVWSLLRPASVDDVPKFMAFPDGAVAQLMKNGNYRDEVAIFNFHKLGLHLHGVEWATLPPMAEVSMDRAKADMWASIDQEVSMNFNAVRLQPVSGESPESVSPEQLTRAREAELRRLGEEDMIIFDAPTPKYTVTVFLDVECKHCRQLYRDMKQINDLGIRVRMLAYPQTGPDTPSWHNSESIWCAADRRAALGRFFDKQPLPSASCGTEQVVWQYAVAQHLRIVGSPIILNERGEIVGGYASPQLLLQALEQAAAKN